MVTQYVIRVSESQISFTLAYKSSGFTILHCLASSSLISPIVLLTRVKYATHMSKKKDGIFDNIMSPTLLHPIMFYSWPLLWVWDSFPQYLDSKISLLIDAWDYIAPSTRQSTPWLLPLPFLFISCKHNCNLLHYTLWILEAFCLSFKTAAVSLHRSSDTSLVTSLSVNPTDSV